LIHWACAVKAKPRTRKSFVTKFESFIRVLSLSAFVEL
jgi:hypothetical protein